MPERTLSNLHVRSWECSPAQGMERHQPGGELAKQPESRTALDKELSTWEQSQLCKGDSFKWHWINGSRSITSQLRLTRTEIPGIAMAFSLPQRQMPKTLKNSRYGSWKESVVCLKHPSIIFGSSTSQTSLQRSLQIIVLAICTDTPKTWHIISANTTPNVTLAPFPKHWETFVRFGSPLVLPSQKQHASTASIWNYLLLLKLRQKPQATSPLTQQGMQRLSKWEGASLKCSSNPAKSVIRQPAAL